MESVRPSFQLQRLPGRVFKPQVERFHVVAHGCAASSLFLQHQHIPHSGGNSYYFFQDFYSLFCGAIFEYIPAWIRYQLRRL